MNADEQVFSDVCFLLKEHNINYWVCHGTLLGIIREGGLLSWDHDIDLAVWDFEVSRDKVTEIFDSAGYKEELVFGDMDCLHFYGKNKKIDISFYKEINSIAYIKWMVPSDRVLIKAFTDFVEIICTDRDTKKIELASGIIKRLIHITLIKVSLLFKKILTKKLKIAFYDSLIKRLNYKGYSYPSNLMVFKDMKYNDFVIRVPIDAEKCLELTYGEDWHIPKKDYIWYEEANNLLELKGS